MIALVTSDWHLTTEPPPARTTRPFYNALIAKMDLLIAQHRPDELWVLGDIFHTHTPSTALTGAVKAALQRWDRNVTLLCGNHDCRHERVGDRETCPLYLLEGDRVRVVWEPGWVADGVWACPYGHAAPEPTAEVVLLHEPYYPGALPHHTDHPGRLKAAYPAAWACLVGHIHRAYEHRNLDPTGGPTQLVASFGPTCRRTRDELRERDPLWSAGLIDTAQRTLQRVPIPAVDDLVPEVVTAAVGPTFDAHALVRPGQVAFEPVEATTLRSQLAALAAERGWFVPDAAFDRAQTLFEEALR